MKTLRNSFSTRTVLIPIIMTVSLFLVFIGMRTPDFSHTQKTRRHQRAVIENQVKEAKTAIEKSCQVFELCQRTDLIGPPLFHVSSFRLAYNSNSYSKVFPIPSRAPPAFHA
jgi:hypothetical protein